MDMQINLPKIDEICQELRDIQKTTEWRSFDQETEDGDELTIDIRLQALENGEWMVHSGDASYDTDHHGYWGAGSISKDDGLDKIKSIAQELIDQVSESITCS